MNIDTFITERHLEDGLADRLRALADDDRRLVEELIAGLSPSANTLRSCLQLAEEVAARDKCSLASVLSSAPVQAELQKDGADRKARQKGVRRALEAARYPLRQSLQEKLDEAACELRKDTGLRLKLPGDLEGDAVELQLSVRSAAELEDAARRIEQAAQHPAAGRLFAVLRGEF